MTRFDSAASRTGDGAVRGRGQTTLDFVVGMSIFLLLVAFVFAFAPGFIAPFTQGAVEETVTTNRVADELATDALGSPGAPYVLDDDCTAVFFDEDRTSNWACSFQGDTLAAQLDVSDRQSVNVTIVGNTSAAVPGENVLCWENAANTLTEDGRSSCTGVWLGRGSNPTGVSETITARRVVSLSGYNATLEVTMW